MRLFLVRHGQSTWNVEKRLQGQTSHPPLTELGRAQAAQAAEKLQELSPTSILSSDLLRAVETATIIGEALGLDMRTTPLLREQGLGEMEGQLTKDLRPQPTPEGKHITEIRWGGGESILDVHQRMATLLQHLRAEQADGTVLVSHGDAIRVLIAVLRGRTHREVEWDIIGNGDVLSVEV